MINIELEVICNYVYIIDIVVYKCVMGYSMRILEHLTGGADAGREGNGRRRPVWGK